MSESEIVPVPPVLAERVAEVESHLNGRPVKLTRTSSRKWTLSAGNKRVQATGSYRAHPATGRMTWSGGTILVDGHDTGMALHWAELRRLLAATDQDTVVSGVTDPVDPADAPEQVTRFRDELVTELIKSGKEVAVQVGRVADGGGWEIVLTPQKPNTQVRIRLPESELSAPGRVGTRAAIVVVLDGVNLSELVGSDLSKATALLSLGDDVPPPSPGKPGSTGRARDAEVNTSVQVRRHSVIRV